MNEKKRVETLRKQIPEEEQVQCPSCYLFFYDPFNLLSLSTLNFCLLCANKKLDKETIKEKYNV